MVLHYSSKGTTYRDIVDQNRLWVGSVKVIDTGPMSCKGFIVIYKVHQSIFALPLSLSFLVLEWGWRFVVANLSQP